jgi:hypothetical protein
MADVILEKPASGETRQIYCGPDSRLVIGFVSEDSTLSTQGDDLIFTFDDEGELRLTDYLKTFTADTAPDLYFPREGAEVAGKDFWDAIFMEDLQPGSDWLQAATGGHAPFDSEIAMGAVPDPAQADDPSVLSYVITMQTTGA